MAEILPAGRLRYQKQIVEDLTGGLAIRKEVVGQSILGSEGFVAWVRDNFLAGATDREKPAVVEKAAGIERALQSTGTSRQIVMTALYQYAGLNNREIGSLLGVDYSTVSQGRKRLRDKAEKDIKIKAILNNIANGCQE
jgi:putative transposase